MKISIVDDELSNRDALEDLVQGFFPNVNFQLVSPSFLIFTVFISFYKHNI